MYHMYDYGGHREAVRKGGLVVVVRSCKVSKL